MSYSVIDGLVIVMYLEELEHIGNHDGHDASRRADNASYGLQLLLGRRILQRSAAVGTHRLNVVTQRTHVRPDELERLLQGVRVPETRVQDVAAELDAGQQGLILVDSVDRVEHCLGTLDPLLAFDRPTDLQISSYDLLGIRKSDSVDVVVQWHIQDLPRGEHGERAER